MSLHTGVGGRRNPEVHAGLPEGVVVVFGVEGQIVHPVGALAAVADTGRSSFYRAEVEARDHRRFEAQLFDGELELGGPLFGRVRRNCGGRGEAVFHIAEDVRHHGVLGAAAGLTQLVVQFVDQKESIGRIDDTEVESEFVKPLAQQLGKHRRGPIFGVPGGKGPERRTLQAIVLQLLFAERVPHGFTARAHALGVPRRQVGTGDLFEEIEENRHVLDHVAVTVDDRMVEPGANLSRGCGHREVSGACRDLPIAKERISPPPLRGNFGRVGASAAVHGKSGRAGMMIAVVG